MNLIHCLRLVLDNIVTLLSTSNSPSLAPAPTYSSQDRAACAAYAVFPLQRAARCTPHCTCICSRKRLRLQKHAAKSERSPLCTTGTVAPRWNQLKSPQNTCAWFLLIDSQLHEAPNRHGKNCLETESEPTCTQDPQAFRRKSASTVIV